MKHQCITITVSGATGIGKSAVAATIRAALEHHGYCVAIPDRAERLNPSLPIGKAALHEVPAIDSTVIVIAEECL